MAKEKLNGYWIKNDDPNVTVYVDKVFKKGYVIGFMYRKAELGEVVSRFKVENKELINNYTKKVYK
ncbi:hypothetical protein IAQ67_28885 (plasmid) [Paenibacillus peoriae]|uniref:Uncharacterized protein n=1 Tax=Paenibacillus peoriae TaxID=59893 RepID=A0A7H0YH16_9BACL|nr:hypothetical protein [Paenibacillus peoriae]QNR70374.1 hypothetical protein IAQ67_28885 [Paenibacillus peoriae]